MIKRNIYSTNEMPFEEEQNEIVLYRPNSKLSFSPINMTSIIIKIQTIRISWKRLKMYFDWWYLIIDIFFLWLYVLFNREEIWEKVISNCIVVPTQIPHIFHQKQISAFALSTNQEIKQLLIISTLKNYHHIANTLNLKYSTPRKLAIDLNKTTHHLSALKIM
jgi:hypothetical protein